MKHREGWVSKEAKICVIKFVNGPLTVSIYGIVLYVQEKGQRVRVCL